MSGVSLSWLDFEWDAQLGPLLRVPGEKFRKERFARSAVMEDAIESTSIQETGQGSEPARMVGRPESDSLHVKTIEGMEAPRADVNFTLREQRERG